MKVELISPSELACAGQPDAGEMGLSEVQPAALEAVNGGMYIPNGGVPGFDPNTPCPPHGPHY